MKMMCRFVAVLCVVVAAGRGQAETLGSVEPIANEAVLEIAPLSAQDLDVRAAFAERLLACGIVDDVVQLLALEHVTTTINRRNTRFEVAGGGFAGDSNPTYAYTVTDSGANAASHADIRLLTDSLGYALSQGSAFLLDTDDVAAFDFPTSFVVLKFRRTPSVDASAALFETVGRIDPELFESDSSGYTQFGRSYVSLQSAVPAAQFIAGYVRAARAFGVEYTPVVNGVASLFTGSAAFPGNDWVAHPGGEEYLARLPGRIHDELRRIRAFHLRFTRAVLRKLQHDSDRRDVLRFVRRADCR